MVTRGAPPPTPSGPSGSFVYLLYVELAAGYAGYVGHTINILDRMRRHRSSRADGKASSALFALASETGRPVRLAILEEMMDRGRSIDVYVRREALWFFRLADAGWVLPASDLWGPRFRRPVDLDFKRLQFEPLLSASEDLDDWLARYPNPPFL